MGSYQIFLDPSIIPDDLLRKLKWIHVVTWGFLSLMIVGII